MEGGTMANRIKCFFLEPTDLTRVWLRRFQFSSEDHKCPGKLTYHDAKNLLGDWPAIWVAREGRTPVLGSRPEQFESDDPRWPAVCECGYEFTDQDERQVFQHLIYQRADEPNQRYTLRDAPAGAMYYCDWMLLDGKPQWRGPDGHSLCVFVPSSSGPREWTVDGRASNCDRPDDHEHKCWVRHGVVPDITVDKDGNTCRAGAGSIQVPGWHGFLRAGYLVEA
jgi:hypothetical protein